MQTIALVIHVFLAIGVIGLVLMQHGKGADAGAAFGGGGGGASGTVFGSRGSGSFLTRATTMFALAFFCTSMLLFFLASQRTTGIGSVVDGVDVPAVQQESDMPSIGGETSTESITGGNGEAVSPATKDDVPAVTAPKVEALELDLPKVDVPEVEAPKADVPATK